VPACGAKGGRYFLVAGCGDLRQRDADEWHLCDRLLRKVLMDTVVVLLNVNLGNPPLHLAQLVA